jgi:hypothetical protein
MGRWLQTGLDCSGLVSMKPCMPFFTTILAAMAGYVSVLNFERRYPLDKELNTGLCNLIFCSSGHMFEKQYVMLILRNVLGF